MADNYFAEAQATEARGDIGQALQLLSTAIRSMSLAAQFGRFGQPQDFPMPDDSDTWDIARTVEYMRPHLQQLGLNDGLVADSVLMQHAHDNGDAINRPRLINLLYAARIENARVRHFYCGPG